MEAQQHHQGIEQQVLDPAQIEALLQQEDLAIITGLELQIEE